MDKKSLPLIIALVVLVIFWFPALEFFGLVEPSQEPEPSLTQTDTTTSTPLSPTLEPVATQPLSVEGSIQSLAEVRQPITPTITEDLVVDSFIVKTEKYLVTLTSLGGGPISLLLNEYSYRDGRPIEMLPDAVAATPNAIFAGGSFSSSNLWYNCNLQPGTYDVTSSPFVISFTHVNPAGGELTKQYTFYPDSSHYDFNLIVNGRDKFGFERGYEMVWNTSPGVTEPQAEMDYAEINAVAMQSGATEILDDYDDGRLSQSLEGNTAWAGVRSKYFAAVMILPDPSDRYATRVFANGIKNDISSPEGMIESRRVNVGLGMEISNSSTQIADSFKIYVGPLDYSLMSDYNVGLQDILGIGTTPFVGWMIKPFAIGVIWLLPKMYNVIGNYGIVIILFALLVKLITMPLSMKSFKSMAAMKELGPQIEELKKKHKKNPKALNTETMKLYKAHGVNPMSSCLPMLPQMPLFFAMFSVFRSTILLRGAPFIWPIDDLSVGASGLTDPYIILVVIMIASQYVSQTLTMQTNQQNKAIMYIMPLFMGFIFYKFAAGLVLYWACFSAFSLIDHFVFKRKGNEPKNPQVKTA